MEIKKMVDEDLSPEEARAELLAIIARAQAALEKIPAPETGGDAVSKYVEDLKIPDEMSNDLIERVELVAHYGNGARRVVAEQYEGLSDLEPGDRLDLHFDVLVSDAPVTEGPAFERLLDRAVVSPYDYQVITNPTPYVQGSPNTSGLMWGITSTASSATTYNTTLNSSITSAKLSFREMNDRLNELESRSKRLEYIRNMDGTVNAIEVDD